MLFFFCKHSVRCAMLSLFSHAPLLGTPWIVAARLLCPWDSPGKNTGVGNHALLQGVFPTQGSSPCIWSLLPWQVHSLPLAPHRGFPEMVKNLPAMQGPWVLFLNQEDPLEKGTATHSSILARKIPWTEEPGVAAVHGVAKHWKRLSN